MFSIIIPTLTPKLMLSSCRIAWTIFCGVFLCFLVCDVATARPYDEVIDSGYITVFVYKDYAPYSWEEDGELHGIDVDIARQFGKSLGVDVRFLVRGADENLDDDLRINIWKGDLIHRKVADVMMHVPFDQEVDVRNELAVLMSPYFLEQMAVVANKDELPELETFGRFMNKPIAVELDTAGDFFLSNAFRGQLQHSVQRGRTFAEVIERYTSKRVPAAMGSKAQAEWIQNKAAEVGIESQVVQPPMPGIVRQSWPIGLAVKHDSRDLGYALGDVIGELIESGDIIELMSSYGVEYIEPENFR